MVSRHKYERFSVQYFQRGTEERVERQNTSLRGKRPVLVYQHSRITYTLATDAVYMSLVLFI